MHEMIRTILARRSIRSYTDEPITSEQIETLLEARQDRLAFLKDRLLRIQEQIETSVTFRKTAMQASLEKRIADLKIEKVSLKNKYKDDPKMKGIDEQITELEALLEEEESALEDGGGAKEDVTIERNPLYDKYDEERLETELEIKMLEAERDNRTKLKAKLEEAMKIIPQRLAQEAQYEREIENLQLLYEQALLNRAEAQKERDLANREKLNAYQKMSVRASPSPDYGKVLKIAMLGMFMTLGVSVGAMISVEYLD
jgi:hypothetical protein